MEPQIVSLYQTNLLCSENFYKFENILPGMRRKVNISTLMVFRNQRRRRTNYTPRQAFFNKQTLNSVRKYGMECRKENKYVFGFALPLDIQHFDSID